MKIKYKFILFAFFSLIKLNAALSAALCSDFSCNPANGCVQGCSVQKIEGSTQCNDQNPDEAEEIAKGNAWRSGYKICPRGFFMRNQWQVKQLFVNDNCFIKAQTQISCFR